MNKKKVGVILTYNCEKLVQKAINNIPKNFFDTVICSDDGSTDKTLKILEENNIPVYQHKHLGYGGNIYSGMEIAFKKYNADYVYELHGDSQYDFKSTLLAEEKFGTTILSSFLSNLLSSKSAESALKNPIKDKLIIFIINFILILLFSKVL